MNNKLKLLLTILTMGVAQAATNNDLSDEAKAAQQRVAQNRATEEYLGIANFTEDEKAVFLELLEARRFYVESLYARNEARKVTVPPAPAPMAEKEKPNDK